jgi:hypothetical protein
MTSPNPAVPANPYRPKGWAEEEDPAVIVTDDQGMTYVFDAILRLDHNSSRQITQHPVQSGANITDHSYQLPSVLTLEIGMSDVMDSFYVGQWGSSDTTPSKSVKAYEQLLTWQESGKPLTIKTRLKTYENMVIEYVSSPDDYKTKHGLRCMVTIKRIITAEVEVKKPTSKSPHANVQTPKGQVSTKPVTVGSGLQQLEEVTGTRVGGQ